MAHQHHHYPPPLGGANTYLSHPSHHPQAAHPHTYHPPPQTMAPPPPPPHEQQLRLPSLKDLNFAYRPPGSGGSLPPPSSAGSSSLESTPSVTSSGGGSSSDAPSVPSSRDWTPRGVSLRPSQSPAAPPPPPPSASPSSSGWPSRAASASMSNPPTPVHASPHPVPAYRGADTGNSTYGTSSSSLSGAAGPPPPVRDSKRRVSGTMPPPPPPSMSRNAPPPSRDARAAAPPPPSSHSYTPPQVMYGAPPPNPYPPTSGNEHYAPGPGLPPPPPPPSQQQQVAYSYASYSPTYEQHAQQYPAPQAASRGPVSVAHTPPAQHTSQAPLPAHMSPHMSGQQQQQQTQSGAHPHGSPYPPPAGWQGQSNYPSTHPTHSAQQSHPGQHVSAPVHPQASPQMQQRANPYGHPPLQKSQTPQNPPPSVPAPVRQVASPSTLASPVNAPMGGHRPLSDHARPHVASQHPPPPPQQQQQPRMQNHQPQYALGQQGRGPPPPLTQPAPQGAGALMTPPAERKPFTGGMPPPSPVQHPQSHGHQPGPQMQGHPLPQLPPPAQSLASPVPASVKRDPAQEDARTATIEKVVEHCNKIYKFAERYVDLQAKMPHLQPSPAELTEMSHCASEVVRLLEVLRQMEGGPGSTSPATSTLSIPTATNGTLHGPSAPYATASSSQQDDNAGVSRPPKRPWEEVEGGDEKGDRKPDIENIQNQSAAEHDMELIRSKRASSTGALGGSSGGVKTKYRKRSRASPPGKCHSCNIRETPEWRRGPDGARTLCNACGLHYAKLMRKREKGESPATPVDIVMLRASTARANAEASALAAQPRQSTAGGSGAPGAPGSPPDGGPLPPSPRQSPTHAAGPAHVGGGPQGPPPPDSLPHPPSAPVPPPTQQHPHHQPAGYHSMWAPASAPLPPPAHHQHPPTQQSQHTPHPPQQHPSRMYVKAPYIQTGAHNTSSR